MTLAVALTAGISLVASGLIALRRRPDDRTGLFRLPADAGDHRRVLAVLAFLRR